VGDRNGGGGSSSWGADAATDAATVTDAAADTAADAAADTAADAAADTATDADAATDTATDAATDTGADPGTDATRIECSVLASLDGVDSRTIDLPNGGDVLFRSCVIQQGAQSANRNLVGYGLEGTRNPVQRLELRDNVFVNDQDRGSFLQLAGPPELVVEGNTFVGAGDLGLEGGLPPGNSQHPTRAAAGLPPAPELPEACP